MAELAMLADAAAVSAPVRDNEGGGNGLNVLAEAAAHQQVHAEGGERMSVLMHYVWDAFQSEYDAEIRGLVLPVFESHLFPHLTWPANVAEAQLIREKFDRAVADRAKKGLETEELRVALQRRRAEQEAPKRNLAPREPPISPRAQYEARRKLRANRNMWITGIGAVLCAIALAFWAIRRA